MSRYSPEDMVFEEDEMTELVQLRKTLWETDPDEVKTENPGTLNVTQVLDSTEEEKLLDPNTKTNRPPTESEQKEQRGQESMISLLNEQELIAIPPKDSHLFKRKGDVRCKYTFSKIHEGSTTQKDFFEETTLPLVGGLMNGKDALLFTYGVTNAGKTFTVQGVPDDTGILPRSLDVIFNSISSSRTSRADYRPSCFNNVVPMTVDDYNKHELMKTELLAADTKYRKPTSSESTRESTLRQNSEAIDESDESFESTMDVELDEFISEERLRDRTKVPVSHNTEYSVFISYAEVYNECVYDLLTPAPKNKGKTNGKFPSRPTCRIGERAGNPYIRNLREIQVTDSDDAIRILCAGQRNRKVAATRQNHESSRSHCLFTVKILSKSNDGSNSRPLVNQLTIVDLAGSERYKKTKAGAERIKEAGTINASLMTLGKCMEVLKWNQEHQKKAPRVVPYRDSKLTRLFKYFLDGKGSLRMIVNIADVNSSFDETTHALKFSALARQVDAAPVKSKIDTGINRKHSHAADTDNEHYITSLVDEINDLKEQLIEARKRQTEVEAEIRQEVAEEMAEQLADLEDQYQNAMTAQSEATEQRYKKKWGVYTRSVARMPAVSRTAGVRDTTTEGYLQTQNELVEARKEILELKNRIEDLELEAGPNDQELQGDLQRAENQIKMLTAHINDVEAASAEDLEEIASLKTQVDELEGCVKIANKECEASLATIESLRETVSTLEIRIAALESELVEKSSTLQKTERLARDQLNAWAALDESTTEQAALQMKQVIELEENLAVALKDKKLAEENHRDTIDDMVTAHREELLETVRASDSMRQQLDAQVRNLEQQLHDTRAVLLSEREQAKKHMQDAARTTGVEASLEEKYKKLNMQFTKMKQQNALALATMKRKLQAKEETVKTVEAALKSEESKNDKLSAQLAGYLGEQMQSEVVQFAATPVKGSQKQIDSILVRDKSKMVVLTPQMIKTGGIKTLMPTSMTNSNEETESGGLKSNLVIEQEEDKISTKSDTTETDTSSRISRSSSTASRGSVTLPLATRARASRSKKRIDANAAEEATDANTTNTTEDVKRSAPAKSTAKKASAKAAKTSAKTAKAVKSTKVTRLTRAKRKVDEAEVSGPVAKAPKTPPKIDDPASGKENVGTPSLLNAPGSTMKKKRKLFHKGTLSSPTEEAPPSAKKNKVANLLTPIKRRLRPRRANTQA